MNRKQFLEVLFDADDISTCGKDDKAATYPKPVFPDLITDSGVKFSINPIKTWRDTQNVVEAGLYSMLFEMDQTPDGQLIPREEQIRLFKSSGLPYSTMTWSGTKSVHVIVRMEQPIHQKLFVPLWQAIERALTKHGCSIDPATMKIPQISRMPDSIRDNGNKQDLIDVRKRVSRSEIGQWLKLNGETVEKPKPPKPNDWTVGSNSTIEDTEKWAAAYNMYKKKWGEFDPSATTGNWSKLINFSTYCYKVDLSMSDAMQLTVNKFGHHFVGTDHEFEIDAPFLKGYTWCEKNGIDKIKLASKEDKRQWAEEQAQLERARIIDVEVKLKEKDQDYVSEQIHTNGQDDYIRVGTKYFYIAPTSLIPWNAETLKTDFGPQALRAFRDDQKYTGFCNNISYTEDITRVGTEYNMFSRPEWPTPVEGTWPLAEKLIRKVFSDVGEDQYEYGLDYIQLILTKPEQMVRALVLGSKSREAGKDTFGDFMAMLVGAKNYNMIDVEEFLDKYNDQFAPKHIIFINEVELDKFNQTAKNKLKNYVTQKTVVLDGKYMSKETIRYYGRLIMATNNIDDFMGIDDEENRFWLRILPQLLAEDKDPLFLDKLKAEIPHFLHFILNRQLHQPTKLGRFWHSEAQCNTTALQHVKNNSRTNLYYQLEQEFEFILDNHVDKDHFYFTAMSLHEYLSKKDKTITIAKVRKCLEKEFRMEQLEKARRYDYFFENTTNTRHFKWCSKTFGTESLMSEETETLLSN